MKCSTPHAITSTLQIKKAGQTQLPSLSYIDFRICYSPNKISRIWHAALVTDVPGPKMAATPALYKKS